MKNKIKKLVFFIFLLFSTLSFYGQEFDNKLDSNKVLTDTTKIVSLLDTVPKIDTLALPVKERDDAIKEIIDYSCKDSMLLSMQDQIVYLYGSGYLKTAEMELNSGNVQIDMKNSELTAVGYADTNGVIIEKPVFKDGDQSFSSSYMRYNFKTSKGIVKDVKSEQADGYLHGSYTKIHPNKEIHILHGKYTTCNADHPHFYIELTKAKVIPKKKIVSGPLYFVIADVPLYVLGLPFGFFPTKKKKASGIVMPTYGNEQLRGFGIKQGGYYMALSDYYDLTLIGDIYSSGSWGASAATTFKKRYKYSGAAFLQYSNTIYEEKRIPDSLKVQPNQQSIRITASYNQDSKRNPTSSFNANINLDLGGFSKVNAESINDYVNTTTSTSIAYQKSFPQTPFNLSVSANAVQNLSTKKVNLKLPTATLSMKRIYPLKRKVKMGKSKWYEDIGLSVTSNFDNSIDTYDSLLFSREIFKDMEYGFRYSAPLSTSFNILKYITCNPNLSYTGRIYPNYISKFYETAEDGTQTLITDTISGFKHNLDYSFSVPFSTKLYGLIEVKKIKIDALRTLLDKIGLIAFRHVLTPSVGYSYKPDFGSTFWGYYQNTTEAPPYIPTNYSIFDNGIFGYPYAGKQQSMTFSIGNNFEMKVKNAKDTVTNMKKIKILDRLSFSSSYNFAADSLKLSPISMSGGTTILNKTSLTFSATLNPYSINTETGKNINTFQFVENQKLGNITNANLSLNSSFDQNTIKDFFKYEKEKFYDENYDYYNVPWSVSANYILSYSNLYSVIKQAKDVTISQNFTFSLQLTPTPKWNFSLSSGYDLDAMKVTSTSIAISRDLHCWNMNFSCIPFGALKSYNFNIAINSSLFKGIEYKRQNTWQDNKYY